MPHRREYQPGELVLLTGDSHSEPLQRVVVADLDADVLICAPEDFERGEGRSTAKMVAKAFLKPIAERSQDSDSQAVLYAGYQIVPIPRRSEDGRYSTAVVIRRSTGAEVFEKKFSAREMWPSETEAMGRSLSLGRKIIDGKYPALTAPYSESAGTRAGV